MTLTRQKQRQCDYCGKTFESRRIRQRFCCADCRRKEYLDTHIAIRLDEYQRLKDQCLRT